jgi:succinate-semialdehyde dehydrogenase/glutarate-semialdehyde dehydrogenase
MPYKTINPATGELLTTYDDISDQLLEAKLAAAHRAFESDWRRRPVSDRARIV